MWCLVSDVGLYAAPAGPRSKNEGKEKSEPRVKDENLMIVGESNGKEKNTKKGLDV